MTKKKNRNLLDSNKIISILAMVISLLTLWVLYKQTNLMSEQQKLSVLPYLTIIHKNMGHPNYQLVLENNGVGPAFIESITIKYKGKNYKTHIYDFLNKKIPEFKNLKNITYSSVYEGQLIPAGEKIFMLKVLKDQTSTNQLSVLLQKLNKEGMQYELIYKSIYKERWMISNELIIPKKLE